MNADVTRKRPRAVLGRKSDIRNSWMHHSAKRQPAGAVIDQSVAATQSIPMRSVMLEPAYHRSKIERRRVISGYLNRDYSQFCQYKASCSMITFTPRQGKSLVSEYLTSPPLPTIRQKCPHWRDVGPRFYQEGSAKTPKDPNLRAQPKWMPIPDERERTRWSHSQGSAVKFALHHGSKAIVPSRLLALASAGEPQWFYKSRLLLYVMPTIISLLAISFPPCFHDLQAASPSGSRSARQHLSELLVTDYPCWVWYVGPAWLPSGSWMTPSMIKRTHLNAPPSASRGLWSIERCPGRDGADEIWHACQRQPWSPDYSNLVTLERCLLSLGRLVMA